jgi:predicted transcriptional regulator
MNIQKIAPESLEVANTYLATGSITQTATLLGITPSEVSLYLDKREVKEYVDNVFLDQGYRNRGKLFALMEEIIESKLEEARESEVYTSKDLLDVLAQYHKMRQDEIKNAKPSQPLHQVNVQNNVNEFGSGKYGELLRKLHAASD